MTALTDEAMGVVVTRRVPVANLEAFEALLRELLQMASKQPGQVAGDVVRGAVRGGEREYYIVYRFADEARLRAWERPRPNGEHSSGASTLWPSAGVATNWRGSRPGSTCHRDSFHPHGIGWRWCRGLASGR